MTNLLIRWFVKDPSNIKNTKVRDSYGRLGSIVGIVVNLILFAGKFTVGTLVGSVAITADAVNNLSDAGSSIITLVSFKLSSIPADSEHPFGHARIEYLASMVVAILILFLGVELGRDSITAIFHPTTIGTSLPMILVLVCSILTKIWLYVFNKKIGNKIDSSVMIAAATDSLSDTLATSAVLFSAIFSPIFNFQLDGYMGVVVSVLIFISGIHIIRDTLDKLLGNAPSDELVDEIQAFIMSRDGVMGVHDLMVHSYGPGKCFASVHVEVPAKEDILKSHDIIDNIERDILRDKNINLVIHLDPVVTDDPIIERYRISVKQALVEIDKTLSMHDFRAVIGDTHNNFIFDVVVPHKCKLSDKEIQHSLKEKLVEDGKECYCVVTYDHSYTSNNL